MSQNLEALKHGPADRERMADDRRGTSGHRVRVVGNAELAHDRELIEVDALAGDAITLEDEQGAHTTAEATTGRGESSQRAEVGAEQVELDDHGVLAVVQGDHLVALIWEGGAALGVVTAHLLLAVVHLAGGDQFVARVREGADRGVEVVDVLGLHVLAHNGLAASAQLGAGWTALRISHARTLTADR